MNRKADFLTMNTVTVVVYLRNSVPLVLRVVATTETESVNIWRSYKQERDCLVYLSAWPTHC